MALDPLFFSTYSMDTAYWSRLSYSYLATDMLAIEITLLQHDCKGNQPNNKNSKIIQKHNVVNVIKK